eukprot:3347104-Pleurochrysis_carterae.AAC.1
MANLAAAAIEAAAAAPAPSPTNDADDETLLCISEQNQPLISIKGKTVVADIKGLCHIPFEPNAPMKSFRLILFPEGKAVRVPESPGQYVVTEASWQSITFPCW